MGSPLKSQVVKTILKNAGFRNPTLQAKYDESDFDETYIWVLVKAAVHEVRLVMTESQERALLLIGSMYGRSLEDLMQL